MSENNKNIFIFEPPFSIRPDFGNNPITLKVADFEIPFIPGCNNVFMSDDKCPLAKSMVALRGLNIVIKPGVGFVVSNHELLLQKSDRKQILKMLHEKKLADCGLCLTLKNLKYKSL